MNESADQVIPRTRVYRPKGAYAHLVPEGQDPSGYLIVMCRLGGKGWLGTGSQAEYEHAASLPVCGGCERQAARGRL